MIRNHDELLVASQTLNEAIAANPRLGMLLMVDPVRALSDLGFSLTDDMTHHVRRRLVELGVNCRDYRLYGRIQRGAVDIPWVVGVTFEQLP
jgi:hypothetical protein